MARTRKQICTVSGINTSINNFYTGQNHVKAVDNLRRNYWCYKTTNNKNV